MGTSGNFNIASPSKPLLVHIAADRIGRSPRTVRRFIQSGKLPATRRGQRSWIISPEDIDRFLKREVPLW
jgi:excisionase family DNA binding protein